MGMPALISKFARLNRDCVVDDNFDYVFRTNYIDRKKKLTIFIVACCGNGFDVMSDEEIPTGYGRSSGAFNSTYFEDNEPWGAKEVVVVCLSVLIVVGLVVSGVYLFKRYKKEQAAKLETALTAHNGAQAGKTTQSKNINEVQVELGVPNAIMSTDMVPSRSASNSGASEPDIIANSGYTMGQRVKLIDGREGTVKYVGPTAFGADQIGIELDAQYEGKHSGMTRGVKYFDCDVQNKGVFVTADEIM